MNSTIPASPLMTTQEAADYLRVSKKTMEFWRFKGTGPKYATIGRRCMYRLADLDAFIAASTKG